MSKWLHLISINKMSNDNKSLRYCHIINEILKEIKIVSKVRITEIKSFNLVGFCFRICTNLIKRVLLTTKHLVKRQSFAKLKCKLFQAIRFS